MAILGLICIGLMGLGAALYLRQQNRQQEEAALVATPIPVIPTATPSPTFTPIPPTATNTPEPTPTSTWVVNPDAQNAAAQATDQPVTATPIGAAVVGVTTTPAAIETIAPPTPIATITTTTFPAQIPQGGGVLPGGNNFLSWAGVGVLCLLILGLLNHWHSPTPLSKD